MKLYQIVIEVFWDDGNRSHRETLASSVVYVNHFNAETARPRYAQKGRERHAAEPFCEITQSYIQELSIGEEIAEQEGNLE